MTLSPLAVAAGSTVWPGSEWPISTPQEQRVDAKQLEALHQEFASGKHGYIHGMLLLRNGYLIFERSYQHDYERLFEGQDQTRGPYNYYDPAWHPYYRQSDLHTMQSISNSNPFTLETFF